MGILEAQAAVIVVLVVVVVLLATRLRRAQCRTDLLENTRRVGGESEVDTKDTALRSTGKNSETRPRDGGL